MRTLISIAGIVIASLVSVDAMALEEPEFEVIATFDEFEVRRYEPYIVAEVEVSGDRKSADRSGFKILAGYIFGNNSTAEKMAMTAPVESSVSQGGTKMAMTAPVTSEPASAGGASRYAFVMERKYTLDTLPVPNDGRIRIREMPAKTVAVRRYSGRWTERSYARHEDALVRALQAANIQIVSAPVLARYNSPFSLPLLRRNEIIVDVIFEAASS